jgi:predicted HicB family RNase H-like nuclease
METDSNTVKPVKLTVEVSPELHRRAKVVAARRGHSLATIVRGLLTSYVKNGEETR